MESSWWPQTEQGRFRFASVVAVLVCLGPVAAPAHAQSTRAEEIDMARRDKQARLWPERESPLVRQANDLVERGFREGIEDGYGANGPQVVLGGMRSGHGMSFGVGYRKTDIWGERIGVRTTGRMTLKGAYMVDARVNLQGLEFGRSFSNIYVKYEKSPRMDFYGLGPYSSVADRSSYLLEDVSVDAQFGIPLLDHWRVGLTAGHVSTDTGPGRRSDVPSTVDRFSPLEAPGIGLGRIDFARGGGFAVFDNRDTPSGTRHGGVYGVRWRKYVDRTLDDFDFQQAEIELQHYVPYNNETRVVAIRAAATLSFQDEGQLVPVFFMPTLGGNSTLRGFGRYRYHDNHSVLVSVEHRWYVFRGMDMAVFADAGKVIPRKAAFDFSDLEVSWGLGFRTRLRDAVIMRNDFAVGRDGFRWMWTFSDIFKIDY
jgi:outer membrane protein assembly factor BamA